MRRIGSRLVLIGVLLASPALANGRFPRGQRLVESETNPNAFALYGTYGLIVSSDAGASWQHVCEAATGTYTGEDPLLELLPGDKILARTEAALVKSGSTWCDWSTARSGSPHAVQDITRTSSDPTRIFALVGTLDPTAGFSSYFIESPDGGSTWSQEKTLPLVARGLSLDVAPSSTQRLFVSGLEGGGAGKLLVSDNGGTAWQGRPLATTNSNSAPFIAAVSKQDPDRLFVRTDAYEEINGIDTASDALLLTTDAGNTWFTLVKKSAKLFGFALSPDESTLLVGYGDPVFAATYVEPTDLGIYRVDMATVLADPANASSHFEKIMDASVTCLRWTATGLYACTSQDERGFEVGRAADASFSLADANPFTALLKLPEVRPLACPIGTSGYACYSDPDNGFASVCRVFRTSCDAGTPPPPTGGADGGPIGSPSGGSSPGGSGPTAGSSGTGAGGTGAAPPAGGTGPVQAGGAAGNAPLGGAGAGAGAATSGSCGCRTLRSQHAPTRSAMTLAGLAALLLSRRRRRVDLAEVERTGNNR